MAQSPIQVAIQQICQEKNLSEEAVLHAIELALAAAYRKDFGNKLQNIIAKFDVKTGGVEVFDVKTVVEDVPEEELAAEVAEEAPAKVEPVETFIAEDGTVVKKFNPKTEIQISEAQQLDSKYKLGDEIVTPLEVPGAFGRMAAQTAKQVIIQRLREVERENVFNEYKAFEHQVVNGVVQRREGRNVLVDLEHATAIMPPEEQVLRERYSVGNRMRFYLLVVEQTTRGPQLIVSRAHPEVVKKIFEMEIPEIANGSIDIKAVAREAGNRSKVAIYSNEEGIDPIGSCVGQRGTRIQTIISELGGEKVDIILFDEDPAKFITNALSPAKVISVTTREENDEKIAAVVVKEDQLSLAIGRAGQNVRLASKLTGWRIDISSDTGKTAAETEEALTPAEIVTAPVEEITTTDQGETKESEKPAEKKKKSKAKKAAAASEK